MSWFDNINGLRRSSAVQKPLDDNDNKLPKVSNDQSITIYDNINYSQGSNSLASTENEFIEASRNISGTETSAELRSKRDAAQAELNEAQAQKTNNDAVNQAKEQVESDKEAYDEAVEQMSSEDEQVQAQITDIQNRKNENDSAISEQESQISELNSNISSKNSQISNLNSQLSSLEQPSESDYMTTDEEGNSKVDSSAYAAAMAKYEAQKTAIEQQISTAENELSQLETQLSSVQTQLTALEQESSNIEQELSGLLSSENGQKIQNQQNVQNAMQQYNNSQQNLTQTEADTTTQIDNNIRQLQSDITEYDKAITEKEREEAQQTAAGQENNEEECLTDPFSIKVGDEEYTLLDAGVTEDNFNSVENFLADKSIEEVTDIAGDDGVLTFDELEEAGINVVNSDGDVMGISQIRSKVAAELGIETADVSNIGIDINQETVDKYNKAENQDLTIVDTSKKDKDGSYSEIKGIEASSTFEEANALQEQYNLSDNDVQEAKSIESKTESEDIQNETEELLTNAKIILNADEYSPEEVEEALNEIKDANEQLNDITDETNSKNEEDEETFGSGQTEETDEVSESLAKLTNALVNLQNSDDESVRQEAKEAMVDAIKTYNIENGVAPEVANAIAIAYGEIGTSEEYVKGYISGNMEIPELDENGNTTPLSKEDGGIQANTGDMEKYGGQKGDAWCMKFLSWLYGEGQGINFSDKFSDTYSDISVRYIRAEAESKGVYSAISHGDDEENNYEPVPGDIMVLENNGASHVAMVINSDDEYVYTIEGNADNEVRAKKYLKSGEKYKDVSGYIRMNEVYGSTSTPYNIDYLGKDLDDELAHSTNATKEEKEAFLLAKNHEGTI